MIPIKDEHQLAAMREAGRIAANVLRDACEWVKAGITTRELDEYAASRIRHYGCLLYTSPSPRDRQKSRMPSSA